MDHCGCHVGNRLRWGWGRARVWKAPGWRLAGQVRGDSGAPAWVWAMASPFPPGPRVHHPSSFPPDCQVGPAPWQAPTWTDTGKESCLSFLPAGWPWANNFLSLAFSFVLYKTGRRIPISAVLQDRVWKGGGPGSPHSRGFGISTSSYCTPSVQGSPRCSRTVALSLLLIAAVQT